MAIDQARLLDASLRPVEHRITPRDVILYNLGIGAGAAGVDADLRYVWETQLQAFPTFASVLAMDVSWLRDPTMGVTWTRMVHGEEDVEWLRPIPVSGVIMGQGSVEDLIDKGPGRGAVLKLLRTLTDGEGQILARVRSSIFLTKDGGFGGRNPPSPSRPAPPTRAADVSVVFETRPEQALIYRLSGDDYPLHVDPETARQSGFPRPILHGLATYGFAARAVVQGGLSSDASALRRLSCRFVAPVYPGDMITTELWITARDTIAFKASVGDRTVIDNGLATMN
ncbi:MaoC/PaaZ C-terminal domain-containing protein [soil metagenome]